MLTDIEIAKRFIKKEQRARDKGIEFNLNFTSFKNMMSAKKCYYTDIPLTYQTGNNLKQTDVTIDRVDNRKGYVKGNVVACCHQVNQLKSLLENSNNVMTTKRLKKMADKL